jgi:WD40 repeat protein
LSLAIYGTLLATAGKDTHVRVWDVRSGECLAVLQDAAAKGNLAVGIVPPEYVGVQTLPARPVKEPGPIAGTSWTLCFDADGDSFFTKTDGSDGHSWDPPAEVLAVEAREIAAKKAQTQKDEETTGIVYCGGLGKKVQLWECPVPNKSASSSAAAAIFASRGPVGYSGMLEVDPLRSLGQSRFCVSHALWKEGYGYGGGAVLATGFVDGAIRLFGLGPDCATPMRDSSETRTPMTVEAVKGGAEPDAPLVQLFGHTASVQCMSWLVQKDGTRLLVSGGREGEVRLWDPIPSGRGCIAVLKGHIGGVNCIAVCDITGLIVTGGDDSTVRVWDGATSMACVATLRGHTSYIVSVMVMGKLVVSASSDGTSRAWWLIMGAEQVTPRMSG